MRLRFNIFGVSLHDFPRNYLKILLAYLKNGSGPMSFVLVPFVQFVSFFIAEVEII